MGDQVLHGQPLVAGYQVLQMEAGHQEYEEALLVKGALCHVPVVADEGVAGAKKVHRAEVEAEFRELLEPWLEVPENLFV